MTVIRFGVALLFVFLTASKGWAQESAEGFNRQPLSPLQKELNRPSFEEHSGLQPAARALEAYLFMAQDSTWKAKQYQRSISISGIGDLAGGLATSRETGLHFLGGVGVLAELQGTGRWTASAGYQYYQLVSENDYIGDLADSLHIIPGVGFAHSDGDSRWHSHYVQGHVGYQAGKYFHLEVGKGKHFWGEGYRSLILGDHAANYPYLRIDTRIWHIKYTNLWMRLRDISAGQDLKDARTKYAALHALSWNVTERLRFSFYELVIWQDRDSLNRRNLDLNYLNPVIFYRPVEYAQGSADNVILGFSALVKASDQIQFYSQLVLDEFLLSEIKAARGWWANKFGWQLGARFFDVGTPGLSIQTEINAVRPFTYTHGSPVQAWGHLNQPLAHPLGNNFLEWVNFVRYDRGPWRFLEQFNWAGFGRDYDSDSTHGGLENYGGNLFTSYRGPYKTYGNTLLQGLKSTYFFQRLEVARKIKAGVDLEVFASHTFRYEKNAEMHKSDHLFLVGIRTSLWRPPADF